MMTTPDGRQGIGSVETAARILFAIEGAGGALSLTELAARCGEQSSKVHRYLVSLGRVGLTTQSSATGKYDLGSASRRLGGEALRRTNEVAVATEHSTALSEATGHAVNISVWTDDGPLIVRWDYGAHALSLVARVGAVLPLLQSAAGQVFFAVLPRSMTARALERSLALPGAPEARDAESLRESVSLSGVGVSDGGVVSDAYTLAAPVRTPTDSMPLVLSMTIPRHLASPAHVAASRDALVHAAGAASRELGVADPTSVSRA